MKKDRTDTGPEAVEARDAMLLCILVTCKKLEKTDMFELIINHLSESEKELGEAIIFPERASKEKLEESQSLMKWIGNGYTWKV